MVQCEMCGTETPSPRTIKVEGAELEVCDECSDFGTEVSQGSDSGSTSTKYSTDSSSTSSSSSSSAARSTGSTGSSGGGGGRRRGEEMFDDVADLATDYDDRIRQAREAAGLSQEDLASKLNEKASLIGKLERGDTLPSDDVQRELERELDISLSGEAGEETDEWEADSSTGEYTLGDMVERKD
jgi:putative transcription factor